MYIHVYMQLLLLPWLLSHSFFYCRMGIATLSCRVGCMQLPPAALVSHMLLGVTGQGGAPAELPGEDGSVDPLAEGPGEVGCEGPWVQRGRLPADIK